MNNQLNILITGSDGQLGSTLKKITTDNKNNYFFKNKQELDISDESLFNELIIKHSINFIINCAAYTDVEKCLLNKKKSEEINSISVGKIAKICKEKNIKLIHISTDFVFDGFSTIPYKESDITRPINDYGRSKLKGENRILNYKLRDSIILRTSWLYSESKNNFVTKILEKIKNNEEIKVTKKEIGSPTYVLDLANAILKIIPLLKNKKTEIYHFSNLGKCSRFEFANEIIKITGNNTKIDDLNHSISNVVRPKFSVLSNKKIINDFGVVNYDWRVSLNRFIKNNLANV